MSPKTRNVTDKSNIVRVPEGILKSLREIMPELKDENDANLVRFALRKFIYERTNTNTRDIKRLLDDSDRIVEEAKKARPEWQKQNQ
jgi:hypothetical protein